MFGRDPIILLITLLKPTVRYLGTNENILSLEAFKNMYQLIASNLEQTQKKRDTKALYLIENLVRVTPFYLRITLLVCWTLGILKTVESYPFPERLVKVVDSKGKVRTVPISDIIYVLPADRVISKLSDYQSFGRQSKLRIDLKDIPKFRMGTYYNYKYKVLAVSSKLDITSVMDSLNPIPLMSTTSWYNLRPWTK